MNGISFVTILKDIHQYKSLCNNIHYVNNHKISPIFFTHNIECHAKKLISNILHHHFELELSFLKCPMFRLCLILVLHVITLVTREQDLSFYRNDLLRSVDNS